MELLNGEGYNGVKEMKIKKEDRKEFKVIDKPGSYRYSSKLGGTVMQITIFTPGTAWPVLHDGDILVRTRTPRKYAE